MIRHEKEGIKLNRRHGQEFRNTEQSSSFRSVFGTLNEPSPPRLRNARPDPRPRLTSTRPACPPPMVSRELRRGRCCSPAGRPVGCRCEAGGRANQPSQLQRERRQRVWPRPGGVSPDVPCRFGLGAEGRLACRARRRRRHMPAAEFRGQVNPPWISNIRPVPSPVVA